MKLFVGADHNGFHLRNELTEYLKSSGYDVEDDGNKELRPEDDYPDFAARVVKKLLDSDDEEPRGILICGSGQGMCIAANRFAGIRAALIYDLESARASRNDDDCNILCLPAKVLKADKVNRIVETWLSTPFAGAPRYIRRNHELDELGK